MGFVEMMRSAVSRCGPDERTDLIEFQRRMFGDGTRQSDPRHLAWLFDNNPCGQGACPSAGGPDIWIVQRQGRIVGHQAGIPVDLKVGTDRRRASWAVDLMVAPEWRLRGIAPALMETQATAQPVALALGMNEAAYKAYARCGWREVGTVPTYVMPLSVDPLLAAYPAMNPLPRAAVQASQPLIALLSRVPSVVARLGRTSIELVDAFDARVNEVWSAASPHYAVLARRDPATVRWRFDASPDIRPHRRFYLMRGGRTVGYGVLCMDVWKGVRVALLADYLASPRDVPALFAHGLRIAREEKAGALVCKTQNPQADPGLRALGFLRLPDKMVSTTRLMVKVAEDEPGVAALTSTWENWFVTMGDSDIGIDRLGIGQQADARQGAPTAFAPQTLKPGRP